MFYNIFCFEALKKLLTIAKNLNDEAHNSFDCQNTFAAYAETSTVQSISIYLDTSIIDDDMTIYRND